MMNFLELLCVCNFYVFLMFATTAGQGEKLKMDTQVLNKIRNNESIVCPATGVENDFVYKITKPTASPSTTEESPFHESNYEEYETVLAHLSFTLKDPVYRRRWFDLISLGHDVLVNAMIKTTDPSFYLKDVLDAGHTIQGYEMWRKVVMFVKNWNGIGDFYKLTEMLDEIPDHKMWNNPNEVKKYFNSHLPTTLKGSPS